MKNCMECSEPIKVGRADKKFCSDCCRTVYNNRLMKVENDAVRDIISVLRNNRKALELAAQEKETTVLKLARLGLDFDYYTHTKQGERGTIYYCFDYAYTLFEGLKVQIFTP